MPHVAGHTRSMKALSSSESHIFAKPQPFIELLWIHPSLGFNDLSAQQCDVRLGPSETEGSDA